MAITDRSGAVSSDVAVKLPVRVATTANISLTGTQTIDGVLVEVDDRVLVKNQTDSEENGIYDVAAGAWTRSADCTDAFSFVEGTMVFVIEGTTNSDKIWQQTTADPEIGSTNLTFASINLIGDTGATGAQGEQGEQGETGETGAAGADGEDGASAYVYIAYASDSSGTAFTTTFDSSLDYIAVKTTTSPIVSPQASDFTGLWKNYKGATGATGATGSAGATGATGAGYGGTSATSFLIGTGTQTFVTQTGLAYQVGGRVRLSYSTDPTNYVEGIVTDYTGTDLEVDIDLTGGSGTYANWNINVAGEPGDTGATGAAGADGATGATGADGAQGDIGVPGLAWSFTFDTGTSAVNPGSGQVSGNAADLSAATALYINETTALGDSIASVLSYIDGCTASIKGVIRLVSTTDPSDWVAYSITDITDNGAWETIAVTYVAGSVTAFAADDPLYVQLQRATDSSTGVGKHTVSVNAGAMMPALTNGCAELAQAETTTNKINYKYLAFDPSSTESAWFWIATPKSYNASTVTMRALWTHPSTTTNFGVAWRFEILSLADDDAMDTAVGTAVTVTDTGGTTNDFYRTSESSAITPSNTAAKGDSLAVRVSRVPSNGSDTMAVDAHLLGVELYYTTDASDDT